MGVGNSVFYIEKCTFFNINQCSNQTNVCGITVLVYVRDICNIFPYIAPIMEISGEEVPLWGFLFH